MSNRILGLLSAEENLIANFDFENNSRVQKWWNTTLIVIQFKVKSAYWRRSINRVEVEIDVNDVSIKS